MPIECNSKNPGYATYETKFYSILLQIGDLHDGVLATVFLSVTIMCEHNVGACLTEVSRPNAVQNSPNISATKYPKHILLCSIYCIIIINALVTKFLKI